MNKMTQDNEKRIHIVLYQPVLIPRPSWEKIVKSYSKIAGRPLNPQDLEGLSQSGLDLRVNDREYWIPELKKKLRTPEDGLNSKKVQEERPCLELYERTGILNKYGNCEFWIGPKRGYAFLPLECESPGIVRKYVDKILSGLKR